jgi:hypothetical protein
MERLYPPLPVKIAQSLQKKSVSFGPTVAEKRLRVRLPFDRTIRAFAGGEMTLLDVK